jgi:hypothetical protein
MKYLVTYSDRTTYTIDIPVTKGMTDKDIMSKCYSIAQPLAAKNRRIVLSIQPFKTS